MSFGNRKRVVFLMFLPQLRARKRRNKFSISCSHRLETNLHGDSRYELTYHKQLFSFSFTIFYDSSRVFLFPTIHTIYIHSSIAPADSPLTMTSLWSERYVSMGTSNDGDDGDRPSWRVQYLVGTPKIADRLSFMALPLSSIDYTALGMANRNYDSRVSTSLVAHPNIVNRIVAHLEDPLARILTEFGHNEKITKNVSKASRLIVHQLHTKTGIHRDGDGRNDMCQVVFQWSAVDHPTQLKYKCFEPSTISPMAGQTLISVTSAGLESNHEHWRMASNGTIISLIISIPEILLDENKIDEMVAELVTYLSSHPSQGPADLSGFQLFANAIGNPAFYVEAAMNKLELFIDTKDFDQRVKTTERHLKKLEKLEVSFDFKSAVLSLSDSGAVEKTSCRRGRRTGMVLLATFSYFTIFFFNHA